MPEPKLKCNSSCIYQGLSLNTENLAKASEKISLFHKLSNVDVMQYYPKRQPSSVKFPTA